ncbi:hypothetical protein EN871_08365 [bacterium M00.F.Ca.ET.228.01.1.1]|nr:hypothetical protein EN871_08365 [bacterium M00.F.Ca.ET.228.01.1.1]TGS02483.1 hypothetical protein EN834_08360 [bacterium M00.F.Ca.ET.191.01.1.1]TGU05865.1 hypothetical protein EN798_12440 [bacterium M00.F.Ca.ET.155.01.1.1]
MKNATCKSTKASVSPVRIGLRRTQAVRIGAAIATALLLTSTVVAPAFAAAPSSMFRFALPGGAAILYGNAANPQAPMSQRAWKQAVFYFPTGATFSLLPRAGERDAGGTQMEPPSDSNISPSGDYVVIGRIESGSVSSGPGQAESDSSREYCSAIEIRTGCITADQTGEICGAGWQAGQPARWGTDDQTNLMLKSDRPSASRLLHFINAGQPPRALVNGDSGVDNLLRCDPPSSTNREIYRRIATSFRAAGAQSDARLIDVALSNAAGGPLDTPASTPMETGHHAIVSAPKASLYTAPDDAHASQAYLVQNDAVTILKQSPAGWAYVDYVNSSGKHLLRWIKIDQLGIKP